MLDMSILYDESTSLLSWERGLKSWKRSAGQVTTASLLLWERGLKSAYKARKDITVIVAPLVGAWIEMLVIMSLA